MLIVLLLGAAIWFGGGWMGAPRDVRAIFLGLLYIAVLGINIAFPEAHPLRPATGGSAALWLVLGGFVLVFLGYRQIILHLRGRGCPDCGSIRWSWLGPLVSAKVIGPVA